MTKAGPGVCDSSQKDRKLTMKTRINMMSILANSIRIIREGVKKIFLRSNKPEKIPFSGISGIETRSRFIIFNLRLVQESSHI